MIEFGQYKDTLLGVPQGGICSPILFNIYMNEFDIFINHKLKKIIDKYNKLTHRFGKSQKSSYNNPIYKKLNGKLDYCRKKIKQLKNNKPYNELDSHTQDLIKIENKKRIILEKQRIKTPSILKESRAIKIVYSRFADDWIILTNSNLKFAHMLKNIIQKFLKNYLELEFSPEKTKITCIKTDYAKFLGFTIFTYDNTKISHNKITGTLRRTGGYNIKIGIDMERILNRLELNGFCNKKLKPIAKAPYTILSLSQIIDKYNEILRGTANYLIPMIDAYRPFTLIQYILEYSCYGTIATKYKSSIYKIFKKYGKPPKFEIFADVQIRKKNENLINAPESKTLKTEKSIIPYLINKKNALNIKQEITSDVFSPMKKINWRTYKNLNAFCVICGTNSNIEWHHVNSIRKGKVTGFTQVMKQLNRKQIPLCHEHHVLVQQGLYDGIKISELLHIDYWVAYKMNIKMNIIKII
jgi:hypothetical protein